MTDPKLSVGRIAGASGKPITDTLTDEGKNLLDVNRVKDSVEKGFNAEALGVLKCILDELKEIKEQLKIITN